MDFLRIAGNERILNDWVAYLTTCNLIRAQEQVDGKVTYVKTELGQKFHEILKDHDYFGPLLGDLSRDKKRPK